MVAAKVEYYFNFFFVTACLFAKNHVGLPLGSDCEVVNRWMRARLTTGQTDR